MYDDQMVVAMVTRYYSLSLANNLHSAVQHLEVFMLQLSYFGYFHNCLCLVQENFTVLKLAF